MKKTITTDFFTTLSFKHFLTSSYFLTFWINKIRKWEEIVLFEKLFLKYLNLEKSKIISFYSASSAIKNCLNIISKSEKVEILLSGYTCVTVSNSIIQAWFKPIYVDIKDKTLWLDIKDLESKITKNTKAILVQYTFWINPDIEKIISLAKKYDLIIIEDCAQSLGTFVWEKLSWSFWDFSIFSFGRDKVISWVNWWILVINNKKYFKKSEKIIEKLKEIDLKYVIKDNLYNILWFLSLKLYDIFSIWKIIIYISRKYSFINEVVTKKQKRCDFKNLDYIIPNSNSRLAINDILDIDYNLKHKKTIWKYYIENLKSPYFKLILKNHINDFNFFRFPVLFKDENIKNDFIKYLKNHKILTGNWWSWINIVPIWTDLKKALYKWDCKKAEKISKNIVLLPIHKSIKIDEVIYICNLINNYNYTDVSNKKDRK